MARSNSRFGRNACSTQSPQERVDAMKSMLVSVLNSFYSTHPNPSSDEIRDMYSKCVGILEPNCDLARYRFLISNTRLLTILAKYFTTFFRQPLNQNASEKLEDDESADQRSTNESTVF